MAGADVVLQRRLPGASSARTPPPASPRAPGRSSPAGSSSAAGRPRRARSAASSRSSPTRSARACAGRTAQVERNERSSGDGGFSGGGGGGGGGGGCRQRSRRSPTRSGLRRRRAVLTPILIRSQPEEIVEGPTMASKKPRARVKDANPRKYKKKTSALVIEKVEYVDYKDVDLLNRFMSDRAKIRNRRVTGNDVQQQREIANAIKIAREMALLPYAKRVASASRQRPPRDGDRDGRRSRDAAETESAESPVADARRRRRRDRRRSTTSASTPMSSTTTRRPEHEGHPALRSRRPRQARRHRRRRRRPRPQLPAAARAWRSWPRRAPSTRPPRCAGRATCATPATARPPRPIATHARAEDHHDHGQGRHRGQAVRLGHHRRHRRRRSSADRHRARAPPAARPSRSRRSASTRSRRSCTRDVSFPITVDVVPA